MGLDMYLYAERYISAVFNSDTELADRVNDLPVPKHLKGKIRIIKAEAAYWRKANAIHRWFNEHCSATGDSVVSIEREELRELIRTCIQVIGSPERAEELLPVQEGFFFGSQNYDEWYFNQLHSTVTQLEPLLTDEFKHWDFNYTASW